MAPGLPSLRTLRKKMSPPMFSHRPEQADKFSEAGHKQTSVKQIWKKWRFELCALALIGLGSILLVEPFSIRTTLWRSVQLFASSLKGTLKHFLAQLSPSDGIGLGLIILAIGLIIWRTRYHLRLSLSLTSLRCPNCKSSLRRSRRRALEHAIGFILPIRRYHCRNPKCRWLGWRVRP